VSGERLKPEALSVRLGQYRILDLTGASIQECHQDKHNTASASSKLPIWYSEKSDPDCTLLDVGLDYLPDRPAMTFCGEAQRIRLATQIGSGLTGVLYVLDEPSIGLHQRDNGRLLQTLTKLRDLSTLIVVEHDEETIRAADHIVDIGPGAGVQGADYRAGDLEAMLGADSSLTGAYLSGRRLIETPVERRQGMGDRLTSKNAHRIT